MQKRLDDYLCKKFPLLYADRRMNMQSTAMCWGFDCGDGWYKLIKEGSAKLEALLQALKERYPNTSPYGYPRAIQVKEKYGTLRFYMTSSTEEMEKIIEDMCKRSGKTCEVCGKPGQLRGRDWLRTVCYKHKERD